MLLHQAGHGFWIFPFWVLSITMDFAWFHHQPGLPDIVPLISAGCWWEERETQTQKRREKIESRPPDCIETKLLLLLLFSSSRSSQDFCFLRECVWRSGDSSLKYFLNDGWFLLFCPCFPSLIWSAPDGLCGNEVRFAGRSLVVLWSWVVCYNRSAFMIGFWILTDLGFWGFEVGGRERFRPQEEEEEEEEKHIFLRKLLFLISLGRW